MNEIENKIKDEFDSISDSLNKWGEEVCDVMKIILRQDFFEQHKVKIEPTYRLKEIKSYISKALYRSKKYTSPIDDIEDKVGARIVLLTGKDVTDASQTILSYSGWKAKCTKDINKLIEDSPDVFSYQSVHIVVSPNIDSGYSNDLIQKLTCEIQVRTLLQHAYAEISHDSAYKGPYKNDKEIIRHLAKSMALMEATDDYFCRVFDIMSDETRKYRLLLSELLLIYMKFVPEFNKSDIDNEMTDILFELFAKKEIQIQELSDFAQKNNSDIYRAIQSKHSLLFKQPIFILVSYYLFNNPDFLNKEWPLSDEVLKLIYASYNISYKKY